jgi:6-phosphogluconolactonase (cycloisomerase 2 family)
VASLSSDFFGRYVFSAVARSLLPNMFEFTADSSTGLLSAVASPFSLFLQVPELVQTDRNGGFLYVTDSFAPEKVRAFERLPNGTLAGFFPGKSTIGHTSSLALDPFTRFLLVANRDDNSISGYDIQSTDGNFSGNAFVSSSYATGTTPVAVYIEPLGRFVYTANRNGSNVSAFQVANFAGFDTLNSVGAFPVAPSPAVLVADPFGKLLFVGTSNGSIVAYNIDPATGALTAATPGVTASGAVQALGIDASGAYLIAGTSSGLFVYSFQGNGGLTLVNQTVPTPTGSFTSITMPTAIN